MERTEKQDGISSRKPDVTAWSYGKVNLIPEAGAENPDNILFMA
jgi:hypothetical protein